jgi:phenylpropionate dioxygenase-like ring-hydroxylating dioxygenase large terminal subunit
MNTRAEFSVANRGTLTEDAGLSTGPVPLSVYRSPEFYEQEKEKIFRRAWLLVGRVEELPEPGCFVRKPLPPFGFSALITRAKSGRIQAFYNACPHRGSTIVHEAEGKSARLVCPYHRWSFTHEGDLMGVTDEANFFNIDKKKCGLKTIATEIWDGWIFINLQPEPEVTLDEFLGPLKVYLGGVSYISPDNYFSFTAELDSNWKTAADAFIETYHIPHIHPETLGSTFSSGINPYARLLDAKVFGPHRAVSMFGNNAYAPKGKSRVEAIGGALSEKGSIIAAADKETAQAFLAHQAVNPTASPHWSMDVNAIFPHVQIDFGPGGFWVHHFWPAGHDKTAYEARFYAAEAKTFAERFQQELYLTRVAEVVLEDLSNLLHTQEGINSGAFDTMPLQDSEVAIRHSVDQVIKWVNADSLKEVLS